MTEPELTPIPGGELRYDDDGRPIVSVATCGHCGRSWNDALSSGITPTPSGRCPFEYEHVYEDEDGLLAGVSEDRKALILLDAMLHPENYPRDLQPDHVFWDGVDEDEDPGEFMWSSDTIEWVSAYLARYLARDPHFRPVKDGD